MLTAVLQRRGRLSSLTEPGTYLCWRKSRSLEREQLMAAYIALSPQDSHTKSLILRMLILLASICPRGFAAR